MMGHFYSPLHHMYGVAGSLANPSPGSRTPVFGHPPTSTTSASAMEQKYMVDQKYNLYHGYNAQPDSILPDRATPPPLNHNYTSQQQIQQQQQHSQLMGEDGGPASRRYLTESPDQMDQHIDVKPQMDQMREKLMMATHNNSLTQTNASGGMNSEKLLLNKSATSEDLSSPHNDLDHDMVKPNSNSSSNNNNNNNNNMTTGASLADYSASGLYGSYGEPGGPDGLGHHYGGGYGGGFGGLVGGGDSPTGGSGGGGLVRPRAAKVKSQAGEHFRLS